MGVHGCVFAHECTHFTWVEVKEHLLGVRYQLTFSATQSARDQTHVTLLARQEMPSLTELSC